VASLTVVWHHWVWIFRDAVVPWYILPFVSGREAVILFFVLSGFVLSLGSPVRSPAQYVEFALRRIGRIYLPFVAAVALSGVCCMLFLGRSLPLTDWYCDSWREPVSLAIVLKELTFSPTVTLSRSDLFHHVRLVAKVLDLRPLGDHALIFEHTIEKMYCNRLDPIP
jgi:peptidoglycan/LPS O-acetylase OafA/YrhL